MKLEADEEGKGDGLEDPFLVEGVLHLFQLHHLEDKKSLESQPVLQKDKNKEKEARNGPLKKA